MAAALAILHAALFLTFLVHALLRDDLNSTSRIAWVLALLLLPIAGPIFYYLYGQIRFGGKEGAAHRAAEAATRDMVLSSGDGSGIGELGAAAQFARAINGFGVTRGNRAELLDSPDAQRARLIADIDQARAFVHVFYYIWLDDETGRSVADALIRAARRGVKVRAGVDQIGSHAFLKSRTWKSLWDAGIDLMVALPIGNPIAMIFARRPDLRNHRKISVIDGRICHCGSQNCADAAFSPKPLYAPWVDVMVRLEGPVARQMDLLFAQCWFECHPLDLRPWDYETPPFDGSMPAQVVGTGPTTGKGVTAQLISRIVGEARKQILLTTPYFVPGDVVAEAIAGAARAGVDVTLVVPARNDSGFVGPASRAYYGPLLRAGVKIMEFRGGLLHAKIITVDEDLVFFGSTNLDFRSFDLNFENDILLRDPQFAAAMLARQRDYCLSAEQVTAADVRAWPAYRRIWCNALATIGPLI
ncbi:phospholipase D-like domain-containing protein [Sphingobium naphthae]|jgi:cardiolipin synthase|uniref:phospholipase D-like domain-containing protein n=1 Tax=Sphingobium naphthae TaxID=1886786 RepID=UPI003749FDF3